MANYMLQKCSFCSNPFTLDITQNRLHPPSPPSPSDDSTALVGLRLHIVKVTRSQTHNTHNRGSTMTLTGFETAIPASERTQTHALRRRGHRDHQASPLSLSNILSVRHDNLRYCRDHCQHNYVLPRTQHKSR